MNSTREYRALRIGWSAAWWLFCVLLLALWVRSYWRVDWLSYLSNNRYANVASAWGRIGFWCDSPPPANILALLPKGWQFNVSQIQLPQGINWNWTPSLNVVWVPHWLFAALSAGPAFAPWAHWSNRYSLRTLLIATTLVAIVLGVIFRMRR